MGRRDQHGASRSGITRSAICFDRRTKNGEHEAIRLGSMDVISQLKFVMHSDAYNKLTCAFRFPEIPGSRPAFNMF